MAFFIHSVCLSPCRYFFFLLFRTSRMLTYEWKKKVLYCACGLSVSDFLVCILPVSSWHLLVANIAPTFLLTFLPCVCSPGLGASCQNYFSIFHKILCEKVHLTSYFRSVSSSSSSLPRMWIVTNFYGFIKGCSIFSSTLQHASQYNNICCVCII